VGSHKKTSAYFGSLTVCALALVAGYAKGGDYEEVRIPMRDGVDSLNVAVATGVALFEIARQEGDEVLTGGAPASGDELEGGYFFQPTLLAGVKPGSRLALEEIFGPVLSVIEFHDLAANLDMRCPFLGWGQVETVRQRQARRRDRCDRDSALQRG